uniref:CHK kinase-like domain-containing protein n=1 Tax=Anopheles farauti TaxID=69004 RepID=A0A182QLU8_9DIPT
MCRESLCTMPENIVPACSDASAEAPDWLNEQYVEHMLRCALKDASVKVRQLDICYAVPKGNNYASIIFRIRVTYHSKQQYETTRTFIVKGMITQGIAGEKLRTYDVQRKEMDVYQFVIPELKQMMKSVGEHSELFPTALAVDRKREVIVFKDLAPDGFRMVDRTQGMDMVHLKMAINRMAKMHAGSLKLREKQPDVFNTYRMSIVTRETDAFHPMLVNIFKALVDEVGTWGPDWAYYYGKLDALRPNFVEYSQRVIDNDPAGEDLCVFVQGDLWVNNFLYKYDPHGKPVDAVILDFQYCYYGSPMIDFCYLYYTSARDDIRQSCFDELLQYYYYELVDCARELQYRGKLPTLYQFLQQTQRKMFFAAYSTFIALPVQMNENTEDADFEALMCEDERAQNFKRMIVANEKFHVILRGLLPQFDRKGLLDKLD